MRGVLVNRLVAFFFASSFLNYVLLAWSLAGYWLNGWIYNRSKPRQDAATVRREASRGFTKTGIQGQWKVAGKLPFELEMQ